MFFHNSITQTTWIFSLEMAEIEDAEFGDNLLPNPFLCNIYLYFKT
jgi:hypothetical protein